MSDAPITQGGAPATLRYPRCHENPAAATIHDNKNRGLEAALVYTFPFRELHQNQPAPKTIECLPVPLVLCSSWVKRTWSQDVHLL